MDRRRKVLGWSRPDGTLALNAYNNQWLEVTVDPIALKYLLPALAQAALAETVARSDQTADYPDPEQFAAGALPPEVLTDAHRPLVLHKTPPGRPEALIEELRVHEMLGFSVNIVARSDDQVFNLFLVHYAFFCGGKRGANPIIALMWRTENIIHRMLRDEGSRKARDTVRPMPSPASLVPGRVSTQRPPAPAAKRSPARTQTYVTPQGKALVRGKTLSGVQAAADTMPDQARPQTTTTHVIDMDNMDSLFSDSEDSPSGRGRK